MEDYKTGMTTGVTVVVKDQYSKKINQLKRRKANQDLIPQQIFDEVLRDIESATNLFADSFLNEMETILKDKTPIDDSATRNIERSTRWNKKRLRDTIKKKKKKKGKYSLELFVGWDRQYGLIAHFVNDGTSPHNISPGSKGYLSYPMDRGNADSEWWYLNNGVVHPGIQGANMVNIAKDQINHIVDDRFSRAIDTIL